MTANPYEILKDMVITEKSTILSETENAYTFRVPKSANKIQIRKAVERAFNVRVQSVRTISMRGKQRRVRYRLGKTPDWKKAIVTLREGDSIDFVT